MFLNPSAEAWRYDGQPTDGEVRAFHRKLPSYNVTPLVPLPELAKELGVGHVFLKNESNRFGLPAFKILGASWAVYKAVTEKCGLSVGCSLEELGYSARKYCLQLVACTEGNWGRAVARMVRNAFGDVVYQTPKSSVPDSRDSYTLLPISYFVKNLVPTLIRNNQTGKIPQCSFCHLCAKLHG